MSEQLRRLRPPLSLEADRLDSYGCLNRVLRRLPAMGQFLVKCDRVLLLLLQGFHLTPDTHWNPSIRPRFLHSHGYRLATESPLQRAPSRSEPPMKCRAPGSLKTRGLSHLCAGDATPTSCSFIAVWRLEDFRNRPVRPLGTSPPGSGEQANAFSLQPTRSLRRRLPRVFSASSRSTCRDESGSGSCKGYPHPQLHGGAVVTERSAACGERRVPKQFHQRSKRSPAAGRLDPPRIQRLHRFNGDSSAILSKSRSVVRSVSLWRMQSWAMRASIVPTWRPRRRQRFLRLAAST